jgi:hypothetical protein
MIRFVKKERLDQLPAEDPRALRSRRDLRRINALMGNVGIMAGVLKNTFARHLYIHVVEIGAGDGEFLLRVARRLRERWRSVKATLVDQQAAFKTETRERFSRVKWSGQPVQQDVFQWLQQTTEKPEAIVSNLFLHHFTDGELRELFRGAAARARVLIAVEPRRSRRALFFSRWLWLLGCNSVTRYDAPVSVRAGFAGRELSALWPDPENWELTERPAGWFSHLFIARRRERVPDELFQPIVSAVFHRPPAANPKPADAPPARKLPMPDDSGSTSAPPHES